MSWQKELARVNATAETQRVEVELYKLRERSISFTSAFCFWMCRSSKRSYWKMTSRLASYGHSYQQAYGQIEKDKADLILEIPADFEKNLVRENTQKLFIAVNAINGTKAGLGG